MKVAFIGSHGVGKTTLCYDQLANDLVAAFFFKDLFDGFELGNPCDPVLFSKLLIEPLSAESVFRYVVNFAAMTNF